jgi:hypothetical protein
MNVETISKIQQALLNKGFVPGNPLGARQWEKFGNPAAPRLGVVMVFWRKSQTSGLGHVGFYTGEDDRQPERQGRLTWVVKAR